MKSIIIIGAVFCMLLPDTSYGQQELQSYLQTAAENNPGLKAKFREYLAALEVVPQVGSLPDPTVAFGYFISTPETRVGPQRFSAAASQMLPWPGLLDAKEDVATERAKSKLEVFEDAKSKLFYDVKSAFYNLYFLQKGIDITIENMDILNTFKQLALIKLEAGQASAVDELRVEMEIADLVNQLAYLQDSKYEMQVRFNNLLNVADQNPVIIPDILWEEEPVMQRSEIMDSIAVQNHRIKQLEHRILSWQNQELVADKSGMPQFMVGFSYAVVGKSRNPNFEGGGNGKDVLSLPQVGVTIPLYRKKYDAMVQEASYQIQAANFEKEDKLNQLSTLFERGYRDFRDGDRRVKLFIAQLKFAREALDILLAEYSTDSKDFEEVLRMERKVLKYELELDKARADKNAAVAFIYYLMGN